MSEMPFYKFSVRDNLIIDTKHDIHTTGDNTDNHDEDDNCHLDSLEDITHITPPQESQHM